MIKKERQWLRAFRKSAVLVVDEKVVVDWFTGSEFFVKNIKYFDFPEVKMIEGELGYLFIAPRFIRIVQKLKI